VEKKSFLRRNVSAFLESEKDGGAALSEKYAVLMHMHVW